MDCWENQSWNQEKQLVSVDIFTLNRKVYLASKASANTPAASGAAADVPECVLVHFPYKSVVACVKRKVYNRRVWQLRTSFHQVEKSKYITQSFYGLAYYGTVPFYERL